MKRRQAFGLLGAGAALVGLPAVAQTASRPMRLGWLRPNAFGANDLPRTGIPAALQRLGWVENGNLAIDRRSGDGQVERLPELARELVALRCDALLSVGLSAARAARGATATVPIVVYGNFDPVAAGLVSSLARPGGNLTGVLIAPDGTLAGKKMELLRQVVPRATRVAFLAPDDLGAQAQVGEARGAAAALGLELSIVTARGGDYASAFAEIVAERAHAVFVGAHTSFMTDRAAIIEQALRHRLPTMWEWVEQVRDGGLMAYSTSLTALYERVAGYVDRLFRGARAGDLPIEQPTTFALVLNQRTARAIGVALPRELLLRAEEVIG